MDINLKQNFIKATYNVLGGIDAVIPYSFTLKHPPTFLIGSPRSGTTLTRLLISEAIATSYFSSIATEMLRVTGAPRPLVASLLTRSIRQVRSRQRRFANVYGRAVGMEAPIEGESIWHHLFGTKFDAVRPEDLTRLQHRAMHNILGTTERAFGGLPFLDKSVTLSVRIRALTAVFPNAIFIQVKRDLLDIAQSILIARKTKFPIWIGPRPPECLGSEGKSLVEQVCEQVHFVEANILKERALVGEERFMSIDYADICNDPMGSLERIAAFMNQRGAPVRIVKSVNEKFTLSHGRKVGADEFAALQTGLESMCSAQSNIGKYKISQS